jgi:hypothetical protein
VEFSATLLNIARMFLAKADVKAPGGAQIHLVRRV